MMRYFKLAYNIFANKLLINLVIALEVAAILVLTNTVVSTYNSKKMLYYPYEELLSQNGAVIYLYGAEELEFSEKPDIVNCIDKETHIMDYTKLMELLKSKLQGDVKLTQSVSELLLHSDGGPGVTLRLTHGESDGIHLTYLDNEIFSKLKMPLKAGRWPSGGRSKEGAVEIVITGGTDAELNKIYDTRIGRFKVVGILTDNTYIPPSNSFPQDADHMASIFEYYSPYDTGVTVGLPSAFTSLDMYDPERSITGYIPDSVLFISFGNNITDEQMHSNLEYLKDFGFIRNEYGQETFKTMSQESDKYMNSIYLRMLPITIAAAVVVMSGLIGSVAITTVRQKRNFGIFFLCGAQRRDCTRIIAAYMTIIFAIGLVLAVGAIITMKLLNMDALIGYVYGFDNAAVTIAEIVLMYLISIILPYRIIKASTPVETIKEN